MVRNAVLFALLPGFWLAALVAGSLFLREKETVAVPPGPGDWPSESQILPEAGRFNLLLFVHPHCPCSPASLAEVEGILARSGDRLGAWCLFVIPPGAPADWQRSGLWRQAQAVPGLRVVADREGVEATRFGAVTSGQTLLYDPRGRLLFRGGLTGGAGQCGENPGQRAVLAWLTGEGARMNTTPVFGCPLLNGGPQ